MSNLFSNIKKTLPSTISGWVFFCLLSYMLFVRIVYIYSYSIDLAGMEFSFLYQLQVIEKYHKLYSNPDIFPFYIAFYPPVYPYFMLFIMKIGHVDIFTEMHKALVIGRFMSFTAILFDSWLLLKTIRIFTKNRFYTYLILLLFILLIPQHFYTLRPDSFKVTAFVLFLYLMLKYDFDFTSRKYLIFSFLAAFIGVFIKHDIIVYISSYLIIHFLIFRQKEKIYLFILFIIVTSIAFFICNAVTGNYFIENLFYYNLQYSNEIKGNIELCIANAIRSFPLLIITLLNIRADQKKIRFIAFLSISFFIISSVFLLRAASNFNYTYESVLLLIVNLGIYLNEKKVRKTAYFYLYILCLLLFNYSFLYRMVNFGEPMKQEKIAYHDYINTSKELQKLIQHDTVFFTNGKYTMLNSTLNLMYGYDLHLNRFTELYLNKPIKSKLFKNKATQHYDNYFLKGGVKYIITENNDLAKNQIKLYYTDYTFYKNAGSLVVYKSKHR